MKNKTMKRILPALLLAALVLGMTGCGQQPGEPDVSAMAEATAAPASDPVTLLEPMDRQAELKTAAKKNEDAKAWLCIPGAEVDDAVMQTENNAYYLYLDETETYSPGAATTPTAATHSRAAKSSRKIPSSTAMPRAIATRTAPSLPNSSGTWTPDMCRKIRTSISPWTVRT